ncbi:Nn.00g013100.m01.CDS01 [Neocucurbitaria sp. VM-36]
MSQLLAPYNNSMRLGQGFNSFTQQICMNDAVVQGDPVPDPPAPIDGSKRISQIVSYSSRFVDKLSDITDAMNVSASLSIKTGTIGGSASGTYIDSDKFKASDLNFFIQVKVTNQSYMARDYTKFQKLKEFPLTKFTEIYGDTFISGWEEGGELNALLSVEVKDKTKTSKIQAALEATLGTPALTGAIQGEGGITKDDIQTSTETTITVNWSGGGQLKDTNVIWDVNSLTLAAANFPELVAMTPQRTYAILTKYTALKSFHEQMGFFSPLDYENAGIYTAALLDAYMDYKSIWKQIQTMNWDFENGTLLLEEAKPSQELLDYGNSCRPKMPTTTPEHNSQATTSAPAVPEGSENSDDLVTVPKRPFTPNVLDCEPYSPSIVGLNKARRDCRLEMIKIVHEVDAVTADPSIALQPGRDWVYLSPAIFNQLIPTRKEVKKDVIQRIDPATGLVTESIPLLHPSPDSQCGEVKASVAKYGHRSKNYRMSRYTGCWGPQPGGTYFNNLDFLDNSWVPQLMTIYYDDTNLFGLKLRYTNGREIVNGVEGPQYKSRTWGFSKGEIIKSVMMEAHQIGPETNGPSCIDLIALASNRAIGLYASPSRRTYKYWGVMELSPGDDWDLRGFYGSYHPTSGLQMLGVIWSNEKPGDLSLNPGFSLYQEKAANIAVEKLRDATLKHSTKGADFRLSVLAGDSSSVMRQSSQVFNALDSIDKTWKIQSLTAYFASSTNGILNGLQVDYSNGKQLKHGKCEGAETEKWTTSGSRVQEISMLAASQQPSMCMGFTLSVVKDNVLDLVKVYKKSTEAVSVLTSTPKRTSSEQWSLVGFVGTAGTDGIERLAVVWGKEE